MKKKTRVITLSALFSALSVVILYFASLWPTGQLGLVALSSLFVAAAVVEMGLMPGVYVFAAASALGMLLIPDKAPPLLFILFFGYYPVIKSLIEKTRRLFFQWLMKLAVFNASVTVIWFFVRSLFLDPSGSVPGAWLVYLVGSAVFALYDYGFSKAIWLYIDRVSKNNNKGI